MSTSIAARLNRSVRLALGGVAVLTLGVALGAGGMNAHLTNGHVLVSQKCWNGSEYMCLASHPLGDLHDAAPGVHANDTANAASTHCFNPVTAATQTCVGSVGHVGTRTVAGVGTGGSGFAGDDSPYMCFDPILPGMSWCTGSGGHVPAAVPSDGKGVGTGGAGGRANDPTDPYCMNRPDNPLRVPMCGTGQGGNVPS